MEIETGPYLTQIDCNSNNVRGSALKFKRFDSVGQNQCSNPSLQKISVPKFNKAFLKHTQLQYKQYLPEQYYEGKTVKPGTQIYKIILEGEEKRLQDSKVPFLNMRFPNTMVMSQSSYSLIHTENNYVIISPQFTFKGLVDLLSQKTTVQQPGKVFPAATFNSSRGISTDHQIFLSSQLYPRLIPQSQSQACVQYVQPFGNFPNILRLFYVPKSRKNYKPSIGYKIVNKKQMDDDLITKKYKQIHNFLVKDYEKLQNLNITAIRGKALNEVEMMTQSLINFIEYVRQVRITEIVVDYIFSKSRVYVFHQIKSIKSLALTKIWDIGGTQQILSLVQQNSNQIICKLCGMAFRKQQMNHRVTNKLIVELITHLKNRGEDISSFSLSLIKPTSLSVSCQVCDLCYELIIAEHQLIDIQHEFCNLLNMDSDPLARVPGLEVSNQGRINKKTKQTLKTGIFSDKILGQMDIYQWRIFFYLQKIKNLPLQIENYDQMVVTMKFKGFKQTFKKQIDIGNVKNQVFSLARIKSATPHRRSHDYLRGNKFTQATNYTTNTNRSQDLNQLRSQASIDMQKVKVFVFYTKNTDISELIQKEQLQFQLTLSDSHNKIAPFKMKGLSSTMKNFANTQKCQQHSCEILLFDQGYNYCNLELNIGLKFDTILAKDEVSYIESQDGLVLYPDGFHNRSCIPLPEQWIQIVNNGVGICMNQDKQTEKEAMIQRNLQSSREQKRIKQLPARIEKSGKNFHVQTSQVKKSHKRPQTCFLSQSSRDTVKRSRFTKNIVFPNDNSIQNVNDSFS